MARKPNTASQTAPKNENAEAPAKTSGDLQLKGLATLSGGARVVAAKSKDGTEQSFGIVPFESEGIKFQIATPRPNVVQYATAGRKVSFQGRVLGMKDGVVNLKGNLTFLGRPESEEEVDPFGE